VYGGNDLLRVMTIFFSRRKEILCTVLPTECD